MSKLKTVKRVMFGTVFAAGAGYVAGLLTAPKSGRETRDDLLDTVDHSRARIEKQLKELHTELSDLLAKAGSSGEELGWRARHELKDLTERGIDTKQKVREVLSAIHDGEADDKDLKNAVKDAHKAITHLQDFFKK